MTYTPGGDVAARSALRLVEHQGRQESVRAVRRASRAPRRRTASPACRPIRAWPAGLPTQLITGYSDLGRQATNPQWQYPTVFNPKVNYTWLQGRHSLKSGYEFQRVLTEVQDVNPLYGRDSYAGQFSRPGTATAANNLYNLADFMFGAALDLRAQQHPRRRAAAEHALHLSAGRLARERSADAQRRPALRVRDAVDRSRTTSCRTSIPRRKTMVIAQDGSLQDRSTLNPDRNNFGPRLGIAYTPTPIAR